jgi:hypothetical protein
MPIDLIDRGWFSVVGLFVDIVGAWVLVRGLIISEEDALRLGLTPFVHANTREDQLREPLVADRLKQSRSAKMGFVLLVFGFTGQIFGSWPR